VKRLLLGLALLCAATAAAAGIDVFYLATPDCPYCRHWEATSRDTFLASPEGRAVNYVEIHGETLRQPIDARHYPPQYLWVFEQVGPSRGVPRFLLAIDGKVVMSAFGTNAYRTQFLPALRAALAERPLEKT
jgi:hypothetical protein